MTKTEFNARLKNLTTNGRLDRTKLAKLPNDECNAPVQHIGRNRGAIVKELIRPSMDMTWLRCMGYLYEVQGDDSHFLCTCENALVAARKPKPIAKTGKEACYLVLDDDSTRLVDAREYATSTLPEAIA